MIIYVNKLTILRSFMPIAFVALLNLYASAQNVNIPHLADKGTTRQLIVNGNPFLILGGELGNSTASSMAYMRPAWDKFRAMHLNTILSPVYWELMEPLEGKFDFSLVDSVIITCRRNNLKLILLWFGSWKNSMSVYAPAWVKTNQAKFPRARDQSGKGFEILSAFSNNNVDADAKAFAALMKHLKAIDKAQTVIMVQVENEIGMLTEAREYTPEANQLFDSEVPQELMAYLLAKKDSIVPELKEHWSKSNFATSGNWEKIFGKSIATDELFQAWYYAKFTNKVAAAGRKEYDLPMFVNAALNYKNAAPGQYPSAGPLPHLMDIWQAAAPAIDMLCPDFYNPYFRRYNDEYSRRYNPLFIPEIRMEPSNAAKVFYAIGHYQALGFSPFSIEYVKEPKEEELTKSYSILSQLAPTILQYRGTGKMEGVLLDSQIMKQEIFLGNYKLTAAHEYTLGWSAGAAKPNWPMVGGIIIQVGKDEFIVAGTGIVITFSVVDQPNISAGILQADEGEYIKGKWVPGRRMNGDQDHQGRHIRIAGDEWGIQKVKLYQYK